MSWWRRVRRSDSPVASVVTFTSEYPGGVLRIGDAGCSRDCDSRGTDEHGAPTVCCTVIGVCPAENGPVWVYLRQHPSPDRPPRRTTVSVHLATQALRVSRQDGSVVAQVLMPSSNVDLSIAVPEESEPRLVDVELAMTTPRTRDGT